MVEFRHKEWLDEQRGQVTFEFLRENNLGFCCVDEPFFPRVVEVTSDTAYVRFHGRNFQKWWKHEHAWERYDYTYKPEELQEWAPKIEQMNSSPKIPLSFPIITITRKGSTPRANETPFAERYLGLVPMSASSPQLKPMTAGDILDQAIRIYRHNFVPLVTIVAIVSVPLILIQVAFFAVVFPFSLDPTAPSPFETDPTPLFGLGVVTYGAAIIAAFFGIFQNAALAWFVSERFLGRTATVRQAYGSAFRRWLSLLIAALLFTLGVGGLFLLLFVVAFVPLIALSAFGAADSPAGALAGLAFLCLCVLFLPSIHRCYFSCHPLGILDTGDCARKFQQHGRFGAQLEIGQGLFLARAGLCFYCGHHRVCVYDRTDSLSGFYHRLFTLTRCGRNLANALFEHHHVDHDAASVCGIDRPLL